jgi:hypothetical protein
MADKIQQTSNGDSWLVDNSITVTLPSGLSPQQIAVKLREARWRLEELKQYYKNWKKYPVEKSAYFREIVRVAKVIELYKDQLVVEGIRFTVEPRDTEHPEAALKRLSWW